MDLRMILNALPAIGPLLSAVPAMKAAVEQAIALLDDDDDQATARRELEQIMAENDAGHARLQGKLS